MTVEVEQLLAKAERNVGFSQHLLDGGAADIAASRAYYAMFYVAEALLLDKGLAYSKHSAVIARFGEHFAKTGELHPIHHRRIMEAFRTRQVADYDHTVDVSEVDAQVHVNNAAEFLSAAREYLDRTHSDETR